MVKIKLLDNYKALKTPDFSGVFYVVRKKSKIFSGKMLSLVETVRYSSCKDDLPKGS
jgi:hypothetical protein